MLAARGGSYAIVKTLIALRADVFKRSQKGCTALAMAAENARILALRSRLLNGLKAIAAMSVNGDLEQRVPGNLNVSFGYVEGESLMLALRDLEISSGSACTSASLEPSHVLHALGLSDELAHSSVRITVGRFSTEEEVDYAVAVIKKAVAKLREGSAQWQARDSATG